VNGIDWYTARAAGVVAYALLTSGVLLGVLLGGRARLPRWPTFAVTDVHRFVALLTGVFVALHVYALLLDRYVHTSLVAVLVPGASAYRPLWVALGTVALELLAAVGISNLLRKRLGHARWRRIHYLTFAVWAAATAHGIGAGTDAGAGWLRLLYVVAIGSVAAAVAWRVGSRRLSPPSSPALARARRGSS
jgi:sulfoxide reductase heme-binding subunit YedZ